MSDDLKARLRRGCIEPGGSVLGEGAIDALMDEAAEHIEELERQRDEARARAVRLAKALKPFANPPLYVFDPLDDKLWIPHAPPEGWIGSGAVNTLEYRRARAALNKEPSDG